MTRGDIAYDRLEAITSMLESDGASQRGTLPPDHVAAVMSSTDPETLERIVQAHVAGNPPPADVPVRDPRTQYPGNSGDTPGNSGGGG